MPQICYRPTGLLATMTIAAALLGAPAHAQERPFWDQNDGYSEQRRSAQVRAPRRDDAYRPQESYDGPAGGFGRQAGPDGRPYEGPGYGGYGPPGTGNAPAYDQRPPSYGAPPYQQQPAYQGYEQRPTDTWRGQGTAQRPYDAYQPQPDRQAGWNDGRPQGYGPPSGYRGEGGFGQPYAPPPDQDGPPPGAPGGYDSDGYRQDGRPAYQDQRRWDDRRAPSSYSQNEVVNAGHSFFGSISQGLGRAIEHAFKSQGRPNGYILGEDAGGAFVAGLRYGEGVLYTKDVGNHRVYWQGPSLGYDFGGEGSKTMVLVYNMRDPSDIYHRYGGVQGSVYVVGGVSVQFQTHDHVTLAVIRSGVGLRLGANVGYLKYTRTPTWNPF